MSRISFEQKVTEFKSDSIEEKMELRISFGAIGIDGKDMIAMVSEVSENAFKALLNEASSYEDEFPESLEEESLENEYINDVCEKKEKKGRWF